MKVVGTGHFLLSIIQLGQILVKHLLENLDISLLRTPLGFFRKSRALAFPAKAFG